MAENKNIKEQRSVVMIVLVIAVLILAIISRLIRDKQTAELLTWISVALMIGLLIFRLFRGKFGYKPTREELEEKVFEKKN